VNYTRTHFNSLKCHLVVLKVSVHSMMNMVLVLVAVRVILVFFWLNGEIIGRTDNLSDQPLSIQFIIVSLMCKVERRKRDHLRIDLAL
jgi:hypothetical protein